MRKTCTFTRIADSAPWRADRGFCSSFRLARLASIVRGTRAINRGPWGADRIAYQSDFHGSEKMTSNMGRGSRFEPTQFPNHGPRYVSHGGRAAGRGRLYSFIWGKKKPAHGGLRERLMLRFSKPRMEPVFELLSLRIQMAADPV